MDEKVICNKEDLVAIADAVRASTGETGTYNISELSVATVSAIENGAGVSTEASEQISAHNTSASAHNDIRNLISGLTTRLNALADSDDTTLDQMSEIVTYIKSNKTLIENVTTNKVNVSDIINNLITNVSNKPLSAAQGVALKALIDALSTAFTTYNQRATAMFAESKAILDAHEESITEIQTEINTLDTNKLDASALTTAVNDALAQAKASGEFKGDTGEPGPAGEEGGYYTPSVDTAGNLSWEASKDGMLGVTGGNIKGPKGDPGTSVTITEITQSTADGGSNVVTFSDGKKLTVKNGTKGSDASGTLDYVKTEAESVIDRIIAAQGVRTFNLAVITDLHNNGGVSDANIMHACQGIGYIADRVKLDAFACLGDHTDSAGTTDWTECLADILACNNHKHAVKNVDMLEMVGNHDHKSKHSPMTFKTISAYNRDVVWGNMLGGYYYKDYNDYKLRIICLNTSETAWIGVSAEQYQWFIDSLDLSAKEDPAQWQTLIMSHVPLDWSDFSAFTHVLKAYIDGTSWTNGTYSCDYTGKNQAVLIGCVHGHIHNLLVDKLYLGNSSTSTEQIDLYRITIPEVTETYGNHYSAPYVESTRYAKTNDTAKDTSFNVLCIDLDTHSIKAVCYGAGYDRTIDYRDFDGSNSGSGESTYTNLFNPSTAQINMRLSSTGAEKVQNGTFSTDYIDLGDAMSNGGTNILRGKGFWFDVDYTTSGIVTYINYYDVNKTMLGYEDYNVIHRQTDVDGNPYHALNASYTTARYIRVTGMVKDLVEITQDDIANIVITLNERISSSGDNTPGYTNIIDTVGYTDDVRLSTSTPGSTRDAEGYVITGIIDSAGHSNPLTIRTKGVDFSDSQSAIALYNSSGTAVTAGLILNYISVPDTYITSAALDAEGNLTMVFNAHGDRMQIQLGGRGEGAGLIVTINEEITDGNENAVPISILDTYPVQINKRFSNSSKAYTETYGMISVELPAADILNKTVRMKGFTKNQTASGATSAWYFYQAGQSTYYSPFANLVSSDISDVNVWNSADVVDEGDGVYSIAINSNTLQNIDMVDATGTVYISMPVKESSITEADVENLEMLIV